MDIKVKLTASRVGTYFNNECNRNLVYESVGKANRAGLGWLPIKSNSSAAAVAGNEWELYLLDKLCRESAGSDTCVLYKKEKDSENYDKYTFEETVLILENLDSLDRVNALSPLQEVYDLTKKYSTIYIYQSSVRANDAFRTTVNLQNYSAVDFYDEMYPDFLRADYDVATGKYEITVIDAKLADHIKANAQIQIALYAKMLKAICESECISNCDINMETGIVWNKEPITFRLLENPFTLKEAYKEIDRFFAPDGPVDVINQLVIECESKADTGSELLRRLDCAVSGSCAYCDNREKCFESLKASRSVRLLPYLSGLAQLKLKEKIDEKVIPDDSIDSVRDFLAGEDYTALTDGCNSWKNVRNDLEQYVNAYNALIGVDGYDKKPYPKKSFSLYFPRWQDFALIFTAQKDEGSGRNYAYSWFLSPMRGLDPFNPEKEKSDRFADIVTSIKNPVGYGTYYNAVVALTNTDEEFDRVDREFVEGIYNILRRISPYAEGVKKKSFQMYVMDGYEKQNIENALFNMLDYLDENNDEDFALIKKVMTIIFWMQGDRSVTDLNVHARNIVDSPVAVLTSEIKKLYVLPEEVTYDLKRISKLFSPSYNFVDDRSTYFSPLSNIVNGMKILKIWQENAGILEEHNQASPDTDDSGDVGFELDMTAVDKLKWHLIRRMDVERSIIYSLQRAAIKKEIVLPNSAGCYRLPSDIEFAEVANPLISKMYFENKYEQLLQYRQIMETRTKGVANAIETGNFLSLSYVAGDYESGIVFKVLNRDSYIGKDWFSFWLCEDNDYYREQIFLLKDLLHSDDARSHIIYVPDQNGSKASFFTSKMGCNMGFSDDGEETLLYVNVNYKEPEYGMVYENFEPDPSKQYLIFERYTDFNSKRTASGINRIANGENPVYQNYLHPMMLSADMPVVFKNIENELSRYWSPDGRGFSESQKVAFEHLVNRKLTILQGPPASGKTDFISRAVITLCRYYKLHEGRNLKVLVSAMSHPAIENILIKLNKMLQTEEKQGKKLPPVRLYKHKKFSGKDIDGVILSTDGYNDDRTYYIGNVMDENAITVIGMTCYDAEREKMMNRETKFDLVIIDEASQLRAMDAMLQLQSAASDARILLVGDNDQLPPIIHGKYKRLENQQYIYGSIFDMYISDLMASGDTRDIIGLKENFRMNGILCRYSAKKIYGPDYQAYNDEVKNQKTRLKNSSASSLLEYMLDPEYPLIFCKLSGLGGKQKQAEIKLVTALVKELWDNLENKDGSLARDRGNFWDEIDGLDGGCGIISPHHEHINRLKTSISAEIGANLNDVYVDTVEKLQGKERTAIIVSYGVTDRETIENESEFIFSRNRFNVSLTRGKAKTIIFLSDIVAGSSVFSNNIKKNNIELETGISYVQDFEEYMGECEADEEISCLETAFDEIIIKVMRKKLK